MAKQDIDWEQIELDYRAGIKTLRQIAASNAAQQQMKKLREHKRRLLAQGAGRDQVRAVEEQMARLARRFNERVAGVQGGVKYPGGPDSSAD